MFSNVKSGYDLGWQKEDTGIEVGSQLNIIFLQKGKKYSNKKCGSFKM